MSRRVTWALRFQSQAGQWPCGAPSTGVDGLSSPSTASTSTLATALLFRTGMHADAINEYLFEIEAFLLCQGAAARWLLARCTRHGGVDGQHESTTPRRTVILS